VLFSFVLERPRIQLWARKPVIVKIFVVFVSPIRQSKGTACTWNQPSTTCFRMLSNSLFTSHPIILSASQLLSVLLNKPQTQIILQQSNTKPRCSPVHWPSNCLLATRGPPHRPCHVIPEDGRSTFLQNIIYLQVYATLLSRRPTSTSLPPWEPHSSPTTPTEALRHFSYFLRTEFELWQGCWQTGSGAHPGPGLRRSGSKAHHSLPVISSLRKSGATPPLHHTSWCTCLRTLYIMLG
jgi:hypothetical protein